MSYLKIWQFFEDAIKPKKSNRKLAQLCYEHFLSFIRLREWRDMHQQLHTVVAEMGMRLNETPATYDQIHRALLTGLLGHIGFKDPEADNYLGARDTKFFLPQDSVLVKKKSKWVMAAELTETTKLFGRCAAEILPEWIEQAGKGLLARSYHDPQPAGSRAFTVTDSAAHITCGHPSDLDRVVNARFPGLPCWATFRAVTFQSRCQQGVLCADPALVGCRRKCADRPVQSRAVTIQDGVTSASTQTT